MAAVNQRRSASIVGRPVKPGFVEMVNPSLVTKPPSGPKWAHEIKWDGYRAQAHLKGKRVQMFTRQGNDWTGKFGPISEALPKLRVDNAILDGEVVTLGKNGLSDFHGLRHQLGTMLPAIVYQVFDLLWLDGEDLRPLAVCRAQGAAQGPASPRGRDDPLCRLCRGRRRGHAESRLHHGA